MSHVFISYDRDDSDFAGNLMGRLQAAGLACWQDLDQLRGGEDWRDKIDQAIKEASALVLVMTPQARASEYVTYEWSCALGAGVRVIPVLLKPTEMHPRLTPLQYLDFTHTRLRPWEDLLKSLKAAASSKATTGKQALPDVPPAIQKAVAALDSLNPDEQKAAINGLAQMQHVAARDALVAATAHPTRDVRILAAMALARSKDARAVPGLIEAQRHWQLRWEFVRLIVPLGPAAVPLLQQALHDDNAELRTYAAHALGEIGDARAQFDLIRCQADSQPSVREAAAEALKKLANPGSPTASDA